MALSFILCFCIGNAPFSTVCFPTVHLFSGVGSIHIPYVSKHLLHSSCGTGINRLNMCTPCGNAHCTLVAVFHKWLFGNCWQHADILGSVGVMVFLTSNSKINSRSISFWINWKDGIAAGRSMYLLHASVTASPSSPTVIQNLSDFVKEYISLPKKEIYLRMKINWCTPDNYLMSNSPLSVWLLHGILNYLAQVLII